jgi:hypothetical protein
MINPANFPNVQFFSEPLGALVLLMKIIDRVAIACRDEPKKSNSVFGHLAGHKSGFNLVQPIHPVIDILKSKPDMTSHVFALSQSTMQQFEIAG